MKLSVIVPTFNEAGQIEACLTWLRQEHPGEILVVDGGSTDDTIRRAESLGFTVLRASCGLANQLNHAAELAEGDILFFVAADSRPQTGWRQCVLDSFSEPSLVGGGFRLKLDDERWRLRLVSWGGNVRSRYLNAVLPDQGLFVRRQAFQAAGGFAPESLIPYLSFCQRLRALGEFRVLTHTMLSSARQWHAGGIFRTSARHLWIYLKFRRWERSR